MQYSKAANQRFTDSRPTATWGPFTRYLEIADDRFARRQVDVFANGNALRYDRLRWCDDFGMLADAKYEVPKWDKLWGSSIVITPAEFDEVWHAAEEAPNRAQQLASKSAGDSPPWINS